jgi:intracellular sulfur oxidation DsrE/DsrF family protein
MRTNSLPVVLGLFLSAWLFTGVVSTVHAAETKAEGYTSLRGVKHVNAVFDFRIGEPKSAVLHLDVIHQTCKDKALQMGKKKPVFAVVFSGASVKLLTKKREGAIADDPKALDEIANMLAVMTKEGIRLEVCQIALKVFRIDPSSILPELHMVGNGYVSLIGYGAQGYSSVPVY